MCCLLCVCVFVCLCVALQFPFLLFWFYVWCETATIIYCLVKHHHKYIFKDTKYIRRSWYITIPGVFLSQTKEVHPRRFIRLDCVSGVAPLKRTPNTDQWGVCLTNRYTRVRYGLVCIHCSQNPLRAASTFLSLWIWHSPSDINSHILHNTLLTKESCLWRW